MVVRDQAPQGPRDDQPQLPASLPPRHRSHSITDKQGESETWGPCDSPRGTPFSFAGRRSPCRACEWIGQPPAPYHAILRGWVGTRPIVVLVLEKHGQHQSLNRQAEQFARGGVELRLSTLADPIGHAAVAWPPNNSLIESRVRTALRANGDATTAPLLVRNGAKKARLWAHVRDDPP